MPLDIAVRRPGPEMRPSLRPVVEAEHSDNDITQFVRQMDRPGPTAVRAARMLELLKLDAKSVIELRDGPGEHDGPSAGVLRYDGEPVLAGKFLDGLDVGRVGPELLVILLVGQVALRFVASGDLAHLFLEIVVVATSQDQRGF